MRVCMCCQGNQQNRAMMLNSKVVDYINYILRAAEFKKCDPEKVRHTTSRYTTFTQQRLLQDLAPKFELWICSVPGVA